MTREDEKATYEMEVFAAFLKKAPVEIDRSSIRNGDPNLGEPDVVCRSSAGMEVGYELGRLIDPNLAQVVNRWEPQNAEYVRTTDSSSDIARRKIKKSYSVNFPVELLLYKEYPMITPDNVIIPTLEPVFSVNHTYARVWFMGDSIEVPYERS